MDNLFAPIIDRSETAFTGNSCQITYYLPEDAEGSGIIRRITSNDDNGKDVITYSYIAGTNGKTTVSLGKDFIIQLYLVNLDSKDPEDSNISSEASSETIEAWLKDPKNNEKHSASSDPVAFWHITDSTTTNIDSWCSFSVNKLTVTPEINISDDELSEFQIQIRNNGGVLLADSDILYSENNNKEITLPLSRIEYYHSPKPTLKISYRTKKGFSGSREKTIGSTAGWSDLTALTFNYQTADATKNKITITSSSGSHTGYLYRSWKNENGLWVEYLVPGGFKTVNSSGTTWIDYTAEFNKSYTYSFRTTSGQQKGDNNYTMPSDGHMYLQEYSLSNNQVTITKQLCIKFNPEVSGIKTNKTEQIIPTFGQYPFIARSGDTNYKTFTIGGLISVEANDSFATGITSTSDNDYDARAEKEKKYRDAVLNWLHEPEIRRFTSGPEGACYVYLSNISLSPDKVSGRNLYSFSCQATEVANPEADEYAIVTS